MSLLSEDSLVAVLDAMLNGEDGTSAISSRRNFIVAEAERIASATGLKQKFSEDVDSIALFKLAEMINDLGPGKITENRTFAELLAKYLWVKLLPTWPWVKHDLNANLEKIRDKLEKHAGDDRRSRIFCAYVRRLQVVWLMTSNLKGPHPSRFISDEFTAETLNRDCVWLFIFTFADLFPIAKKDDLESCANRPGAVGPVNETTLAELPSAKGIAPIIIAVGLNPSNIDRAVEFLQRCGVHKKKSEVRSYMYNPHYKCFFDLNRNKLSPAGEVKFKELNGGSLA